MGVRGSSSSDAWAAPNSIVMISAGMSIFPPLVKRSVHIYCDSSKYEQNGRIRRGLNCRSSSLPPVKHSSALERTSEKGVDGTTNGNLVIIIIREGPVGLG